MTVQARSVILLSFALVAACGEELLPTYDLSGNTMGTTFNITVVAPPPDSDLDALREKIYAELGHIEDLASTYREESELSRFNRNPSIDWIDVSHELCDMVESALAVGKTSHGAFDITVGPLVNLWGFGPTDTNNTVPTDEQIAAALKLVGNKMVEADCTQPALFKPSTRSPRCWSASICPTTSWKLAANCASKVTTRSRKSSPSQSKNRIKTILWTTRSCALRMWRWQHPVTIEISSRTMDITIRT
jgi:hypothetical protein